MISDQALNVLKGRLRTEEGLMTYIYDDADGQPLIKGKMLRGNATFGVGRKNRISIPEAYILLTNDIEAVDGQLTKALSFYPLIDDVRKTVLIDMCFNMGINSFMNFTHMIEAMRNNDFKTAAIAMMESDWAKQVGKRASFLSQIMDTGSYSGL